MKFWKFKICLEAFIFNIDAFENSVNFTINMGTRISQKPQSVMEGK